MAASSTDLKVNHKVLSQLPNKYVQEDGCFTVPDNVRVITCGAFRKCPELKQIIIPSTVTHLNTRAFCENPNLEQITMHSSTKFMNTHYKNKIYNGRSIKSESGEFNTRKNLKVTIITNDFFADLSSITTGEWLPPDARKNVKIEYTSQAPQEHNDKEKPGAYGDLELIVDDYIKTR